MTWNDMKRHETTWNNIKRQETSWNYMKWHEMMGNDVKWHEMVFFASQNIWHFQTSEDGKMPRNCHKGPRNATKYHKKTRNATKFHEMSSVDYKWQYLLTLFDSVWHWLTANDTIFDSVWHWHYLTVWQHLKVFDNIWRCLNVFHGVCQDLVFFLL